MAPKPIRSVGKVRPEATVAAEDRDTIAASLAAEGISSTAEFIEAIDERAAAGHRDPVGDAVAIATAEKTSENCRTYTVQQLQESLVTSVSEMFGDVPFTTGFDFRKKNHDGLVEASKAILKKHAGKPAIVLTEEESQEFRAIMDSQGSDDCMTTDQAILEEVTYALAYLRKSVLAKLGVKQSALPDQMVDPDDEDGGDLQMGDAEAFVGKLCGTDYIATKHVCCGKCGGHKE